MSNPHSDPHPFPIRVLAKFKYTMYVQTKTVVDFLKISAYHVLGHGTGATAALEMGRRAGRSGVRSASPDAGAQAVLSVTLASPIPGGTTLPSDFLESLRSPYTRGGNEVCAQRTR